MSRDAVAELVSAVARRGLATPARILLDAHRPLAPLLADLAVTLRPLLRAAGDRAVALGDLAAERNGLGLERLAAELDEKAAFDGRRRAECRTPES